MKKNAILIIIIGLIILTGFSLSRYFYLQKANLQLQAVIKDNKAKIDDLAGRLLAQKDLNAKLRQEKEALNVQLQGLAQELKQNETELSSAKDRLNEIQTKMNLLKKENIYLASLKASFDTKLELANKQKQGLEARLNSIEELKKAIIALKDKMRQERLSKTKKPKIREEQDGNKGYVVWKGQPTLKNKVRIEVIPAS